MDIQQFPVPEERYADQKAIHSYLRSEDYKQAIKTIDKRLPKIDKIREFEKESWLKVRITSPSHISFALWKQDLWFFITRLRKASQ